MVNGTKAQRQARVRQVAQRKRAQLKRQQKAIRRGTSNIDEVFNPLV